MATPGELVKVVADTTGEDVATVTQHDRNLVLAGIRAKSGRGRSAYRVTARDAAVLLTSVLGSHRVRDGVDTVRRYFETQEHHAFWREHHPDHFKNMGEADVWVDCGLDEMAALPPEHSFVDALAALIESAAAGRLIRHRGTEKFELARVKLQLAWPIAHAKINILIGYGGPEINASYRTRDPSFDWTEEQISVRMSRWAATNELPLIYVGALLAGKLDQMPEIEDMVEELRNGAK